VKGIQSVATRPSWPAYSPEEDRNDHERPWDDGDGRRTIVEAMKRDKMPPKMSRGHRKVAAHEIRAIRRVNEQKGKNEKREAGHFLSSPNGRMITLSTTKRPGPAQQEVDGP